jgi:hypothetical protein
MFVKENSFVVRWLIVATLLLEEWEDDIHTPKILKFNFRGQNTSH